MQIESLILSFFLFAQQRAQCKSNVKGSRATAPTEAEACVPKAEKKLSTIAILNDVRNMMGVVVYTIVDYCSTKREAVTTILWHPEGKCKLFPPCFCTLELPLLLGLSEIEHLVFGTKYVSMDHRPLSHDQWNTMQACSSSQY